MFPVDWRTKREFGMGQEVGRTGTQDGTCPVYEGSETRKRIRQRGWNS